ncbi:MAG: hypothetical protein IT445_05395 [Phycisphaeraceae bacterium]|nr:hypothetical protein [Phycisphaeraceae bacterium]
MLTGALAVVPAGAQDQTPIAPVGIQSVGGELFIEDTYREDHETRGRFQTKSDDTDLLLREGIRLLVDGYSYHPNLIDWYADLRFGLMHQQTTLLGEDRRSEGFLTGYDLQAHILKQKPVSFRAYATRDERFEDRSFARNLDIQTESEGIQAFWHSMTPADLLLERRKVHESSESRINDEETYQARFTIEDRRTRDNLTRLIFNHEDTDQQTDFLNSDGSRITQNSPDQSDELSLTNRWLFDAGDGRQHQVDGVVRLLHRTGFFRNDLYFIDQRLTLAHTDSFSTFYRGTLNFDDTDEETDHLLRGEIGLIQRIYESMIVTASGYASDRQLSSGYEKIFGAELNVDYQKLTPIGIYQSNLLGILEFHEQAFDQGAQNVFNESITLNNVANIALSQPNVFPGTIRVTDISQAITYVEGIDYLVNQFGPVTQIQRLVGGNIGNGETVLVDYIALTSPFAQYQERLINLRNRFDFDAVPLALYVDTRWRSQVLTGGEDPGNLDVERTILYGAELSPGPFRISAEYETRDHTLFPSWWAYRGRASVMQIIENTTSFSAGLEYEMLQYVSGLDQDLGPGRDFLETYGAYLNLTTRLNKSLLWQAEASSYHTKGRDRAQLTRFGTSILWTRGLLEVELGGHYDIWEQELDSGNSLFVNLNVIRRF